MGIWVNGEEQGAGGGGGGGGGILRKQSLSRFTTAASTTTATPIDGTVPQSSETTSYNTVSFTPTQSDSIIRCTVIGSASNASAGISTTVALFKDGESGSLVSTILCSSHANAVVAFSLGYSFAPGSTSAIVFDVRFGRSTTGTAWIPATSNLQGAAGPSVVVIIEEFAP